VYPYIVATSPLPVTLLSFEGKQMEEDILLSWSTASETNNQYFSVERSPDGIHFETAGQVSGAGNSNQVIQYRFTDINPLPGINYYRLTQVDFDGLSTTSAIIAIRYYKNFSVKVENNPVEDELNISVHAEYTSLIKIRLINDLGETVQEFSTRATKGFNQISIPVMQLHQGMYFLKSENGPGTSWTRFLKL
jgi:hypothetical protein